MRLKDRGKGNCHLMKYYFNNVPKINSCFSIRKVTNVIS